MLRQLEPGRGTAGGAWRVAGFIETRSEDRKVDAVDVTVPVAVGRDQRAGGLIEPKFGELTRAGVSHEHVEVAVVVHVGQYRHFTFRIAQALATVGEVPGTVVQPDLVGTLMGQDNVGIAVPVDVAGRAFPGDETDEALPGERKDAVCVQPQLAGGRLQCATLHDDGVEITITINVSKYQSIDLSGSKALEHPSGELPASLILASPDRTTGG